MVENKDLERVVSIGHQCHFFFFSFFPVTQRPRGRCSLCGRVIQCIVPANYLRDPVTYRKVVLSQHRRTEYWPHFRRNRYFFLFAAHAILSVAIASQAFVVVTGFLSVRRPRATECSHSQPSLFVVTVYIYKLLYIYKSKIYD